MELTTPRLRLRELTLDDVDVLNAIERDPLVTRYMAFDRQSVEDTRAYIERGIQQQAALPRTTFDLAMMLLSAEDHAATRSAVGGSSSAAETFVGRCGFHIARPEHAEAMLWYELHPGYWGRGLATEAASAMLDFAFGTLGLHRVWADCDPRNLASCRVAERLGMTLEGRLRENYRVKGEWCDSAVYGVLDREWQARRALASMRDAATR